MATPSQPASPSALTISPSVGYTNFAGGTGLFPVTTGAIQTLIAPTPGSDSKGNPIEVNGADYNAFVSRLSADGKSLLYSTFLGGNNNSVDVANAVALDAAGNVYVVGRTTHTTYSIPQGSYTFAPTPGWAVTGDGSGYGGGTGYGPSDFPTTSNAYQRAYDYSKSVATCNQSSCTGPNFESSFLSVISAAGTLVYSTVVTPPGTGGCGNGDCDTYSNAVAVGPNNIVYVGGSTNSLALPVTANAFLTACTPRRATDCSRTGYFYAIDISKSGTSSLVFSTYVNGTTGGVDSNGNTLSPTSEVDGLAIDSKGNVVMTGFTSANNFPTTSGTFQPTCPNSAMATAIPSAAQPPCISPS